MSFFCCKKIKLNKTIVMWLLAFILAISCIIFGKCINKKDSIKYDTYSYIGKIKDEQVVFSLAKKNQKENDIDKSVTVSQKQNALDNMHASYSLLMDGKNGRVLYEHDGNKKVPIASTTKIMTLIVTLENGNLDDMVKISKNASIQPDVQLGLEENEEYRLKDLLYSLMLESHNDTAVAIAEHIGNSVEGFAKLMNQKAKDLGLKNTNFVTPNGLDDKNHYSTAYDLALLTKYCLQNKTFVDIINTRQYTFHEQTKGKVYTVFNKNRFLDTYDNSIGVKTGFTGNAGYCFVGAIDLQDYKLISVVLACGWPPHKEYKWNDTTRLMNYGKMEFHNKCIIQEGITFQSVKVKEGIECKEITPYVKENVNLLLKDTDIIKYDVKVPKFITAPIKKNQIVGNVSIYINGEKYKCLNLYSQKTCKRRDYKYIFKGIIKKYLMK